MITGRQIRAARGLLNWDATVLAEKAKITRATVSRTELGTVQPHEDTLKAIARVFDENDVEFIDNDGVRLKPRNIETYEGATRFDEFYDFIYHHLKQHGGSICVAGSSGKLYSKYRNDPDLHRKRMAELKEERPDFSIRLLVEEGDYYMPNAAYSQYRWQKKEHFPPTGLYIFGSCVALISFEGVSPPFVILIKSPLFTEAYRRSFDLMWSLAETPPNEPPTKKA